MNWDWPPSRHGGTTERRAARLATSLPWSRRITCRHRSIPAPTPAEVSTSPSSTNSTPASSRTRGYSARNRSACSQCVAARRPSSTPAAASTNAPVQIDISRAPAPAVCQGGGHRRFEDAVGQRRAAVHARHDHRVGGRQDLRPVAGHGLKPRRRAHRTAVRRADRARGRAAVRAVARRAEDLRGHAQVEHHDVVESEDGDLMRAMARLFQMLAFRPLVRESWPCPRIVPVTATIPDTPPKTRLRLHRAWIVAAVALVALVGAAGFRATPGVLIDPLREEFGWPRGTISSAVSVNLVLYGLTSPFAAALMDRFGMRKVVADRARARGGGQRPDRVHDRAVGAHRLLGRPGRPGHRVDGDGVRGHRDQPLVRRAPRHRHRRAHRGGRGRAARLPAGPGPPDPHVRLARRPR